MNSLLDFLRARLDEDEAAARRAGKYASPDWTFDADTETVLWWRPAPHVAETERRHGMTVTSDRWSGETIEVDGEGIGPHIARHDPARVLRDVAARRRMLDALKEADPQGHGACISATYRVEDALCDLAAAYEDHPDYQESWRP